MWCSTPVSTRPEHSCAQQVLAQEVALLAVMACALIGYDRIAAVAGLAAIAAFGPIGLHTQLVWLTKAVVPIACLLVMVLAPRKRPRDPRRLLWLLPVGALAALEPHVHVGLLEVLALISLGGLVRLFHDPRLAIASGLTWLILVSAHASRPTHPHPGMFMLLAVVAAGLALSVTARRRWIMRHSATA